MKRIIASVLAFVILTSYCSESYASFNPFSAIGNKISGYRARRQESKEAKARAMEENQALNNLSTVITTLSAKLKTVYKQFSSARSLLIKQTDQDDPKIDETYLISIANIFHSVNATYENYERGMNLFGQGLAAVLKILNQGKEELLAADVNKKNAGIEKMNAGLKKLRSAYADLCAIRAVICLLWQYVAFTIEHPPSLSKSDEDEQAATAEPVCNIFSSGVLTTAVSNIREMMHERKTTFLRKTEEGLNNLLNRTISALSVAAASPHEDLNKLIEGVKDQIQYITQYNDEVETLFTVIDTLAKAIKTENIDTETVNKAIGTLRKALNPPQGDKAQPQES